MSRTPDSFGRTRFRLNTHETGDPFAHHGMVVDGERRWRSGGRRFDQWHAAPAWRVLSNWSAPSITTICSGDAAACSTGRWRYSSQRRAGYLPTAVPSGRCRSRSVAWSMVPRATARASDRVEDTHRWRRSYAVTSRGWSPPSARW